MDKLHINSSKPYDVYIGENLFDACAEYIKENFAPQTKVLIVADENVPFDYDLRCAIKDAGFSVKTLTVPGRDKTKTLSHAGQFIEWLLHKEYGRDDLLIALGGGTVSDFTGFVASIYKRGMKYINVPTTLLSMADACIGGKTALDVIGEKNVVGTVYSPSLVVCDTALLKSAPQSVINQGYAEAIKCAVICDKEFFDNITTMTREEVIERALRIKADFIEKDEFDNNERHMLNLGHTFAHAIEKLTDFTVPHGNAVSMGLVMAAEYSNEKGMLSLDEVEKIKQKLAFFSLPVECKYSKNKIWDNIYNDKKIKGDKISIILPVKIGECIILEEKI